MQKSGSNQSMDIRRRTQASNTLNRRYVKRPEVKNSIPEPHPMQVSANNKMRQMSNTSTPARPTAKELKDAAIKKALNAAARVDTTTDKKSSPKKFHFGFGRIMLALACTAAAVFAIIYFVNASMPDLSLHIAAAQTGIDVVYPSYIPRDFSETSITSEKGKVSIVFTNANTNASYTLSEEKSSWDSTALLNNFVKPEYGNNYDTIHEQGLTIYISGAKACWASGGIVFKLDSSSLSKKQIKSIAVSL